MKIVYIVFNETNKGTYFRALGFAKEMTARGHKVTIIATSPINKFKKKEIIIERNILLVEMPDLFSGSLRSGWDIWNIINRIHWLKNKKFDLVHAFESRPTVLYPSLFLMKKKIPLIMDWADWFGKGGSVEERINPIIRLLLRPVETYFENNFRHKANFSTVICTELRRKLISLGIPKEKILLIRNGVDIRIGIPYEKKLAREKIKVDSNKYIIGWLGATFKYDAKLMLDAFNILSDEYDNVLLLLAGYFNHDFSKVVKNPEKIVSTGFLNQNELDYYLSSVDIFWLPLRNTLANQGRFPYKITQYMSYGKPIISSHVGDIPEIFNKEEIGILVADQPDEFAKNTSFLLQNRALMEKMGKNAKRLVQAEFAWDKISDPLEDLYYSLIENQKN